MGQGRRAAAAFVVVVMGGGLVASAQATDLNLRLRSGGVSFITVAPGTVVNWAATGELGDALNEGLALFCFDLQWSGGALAPAATPTSGPLVNFARPAGINNPAGFGGTASIPGRLLQVGGAQNTINNVFAPYPGGSVITGVAAPGQPATLATGQFTAPMQPGTYSLSASNLVANVIRQGETGTPFWHVEKAIPGFMTFLTVQVATGSRSEAR